VVELALEGGGYRVCALVIYFGLGVVALFKVIVAGSDYAAFGVFLCPPIAYAGKEYYD
jgi:hypothetical protein